jgi:hypothetical protein
VTLPRLPDRDAGQVDALVADRYLDDLLSAAERRSGDVPADASLDPALRRAAGALRRTLVRVHPSFRFEERLAARLADLAAAQARPALAAAGGGAVIPFQAGDRPHEPAAGRRWDPVDPLLPAVLRGELDPADGPAVARATGPAGRRPLIVGGTVITSAAISIVGVAIVAWRATRPADRAATGGHLTGPA